MLQELENTQLCPICKRDGEAEPADYICDICDKPMCFSHRNHNSFESLGGECTFCDDCIAK